MEQAGISGAAMPQDHAAAAKLRHFFTQQVAEAMPKAFERALRDAFCLSRFLVNGTMRVQPTVMPVLDLADLVSIRDLSVSTLLVLLMDQRQSAAVTAAARDALAAQYLADDDTQALIISTANRIARQAVQDLQVEQAEHKALFGRVVAGARVLDASEC